MQSMMLEEKRMTFHFEINNIPDDPIPDDVTPVLQLTPWRPSNCIAKIMQKITILVVGCWPISLQI